MDRTSKLKNMNPVLENFQKAIKRLEEVLEMKKTTVTRDSAIKRFELCFDLAWKSLKMTARHEGIECYSPRSCFQSAFELGLIEHNTTWFEMIENRNKSVHLYEESSAELIYAHLPSYVELLKQLFTKIKTKTE